MSARDNFLEATYLTMVSDAMVTIGIIRNPEGNDDAVSYTINIDGENDQAAIDDLAGFMDMKLTDRGIAYQGNQRQSPYTYFAVDYPGQDSSPLAARDLYTVMAEIAYEWQQERAGKNGINPLPSFDQYLRELA